MNGGFSFLAEMRSHYVVLKNLCYFMSAISGRMLGSTTKMFLTKSLANDDIFLGS